MAFRKITQATIAQELNITRNTVCKALGGHPGVSRETARIVRETALKLGYSAQDTDPTFDLSRESFAPMQIAFLGHSDSLRAPYWLSIISGIEEYLAQVGATLRFVVVTPEQERFLTLPPMLLLPGLQGILMAGCFSKEYYDIVRGVDLPIVSYDIHKVSSFSDKPFDIVMLENEDPVFYLTEALIQKGMNRLVFAGNPDCCQSFHERFSGFQKVMRMHNLEPIHIPLLMQQSPRPLFTVEELSNAIRNAPQRPTAFVCANDAIAEVISRFKASAGGDSQNIEICGFDNSSEYPLQAPLFGTVDCGQQDIGTALANQVLFRIKNPMFPLVLIRLEVKVKFRSEPL